MRQKAFFLLLLFSSVVLKISQSQAHDGSGPIVQLIQNGAITKFENQYIQEILANDAQRVLRSCTVKMGDTPTSDELWKDALEKSSLLVTYPKGQTLSMPNDSGENTRDISITEILIPLPEDGPPAELLLRDSDGAHAFTKYDANLLARIVCRGELMLMESKAYSALCSTAQPK